LRHGKEITRMKMKAFGLKKSLRACVAMAVAATFLTLTACAVQKPFRFSPRSISRISYDPGSCSQMMNGTFKCRDVIFTVTTVEIPKQK
jgi:hypothetical protein